MSSLVQLFRSQTLRALGVLALCGFASERASAEESDFRVETRIFAEAEDRSVGGNITIFRGSKVYDFKEGRSVVTILDLSAGKVTLLDSDQQIQTVLKTDTIDLLVDRLKAAAIERSDPLVKFAAQPQFKVTIGHDQLRLIGGPLSFRVTTTKPEILTNARRFREFADAYARLNSIRPGCLPPFARLSLNRELANRDLLPKSIELSLQRIDPETKENATTRFRSDHKFSFRLTDADLHKIETARGQTAQFQSIELPRFLRGQSH